MPASYRLLTFSGPKGPRAGIAVGNKVADAVAATGNPADASVQAILEDWDNAQTRLAQGAQKIASSSVTTHDIGALKLLSPVHWPVSIYCAGANYSDHVARMAAKQGLQPDPNPKSIGLKPWHFLKPSRTAVGHNEDISVVSAALDWEIELVAVIGKTARNISIADAYSCIAGFSIANDLSARDLSRRNGISDTAPFKWDWIGQKCFDGSCPIGPWIAPASEIADPMNLKLQLFVNDELKQDSNTGLMIFNIADQISHLSSRLTLHPGDVILTGTPCGVGAESGEFLKAGDVMRVEIEGIGALVNRVASITG